MSAQREMTLQEWVDKLPGIHSAHKEFDSLQATIAQQAELIVLCESALTTTIANSPEPYCAITRRIRAEQEDAIAAIAAQKGGAA